MTTPLASISALVLLATATTVSAQTAEMEHGRPKDATGLCKDGTFYTGAEQANACQKNGGLKEWWGPNAPGVVSPVGAPPANPRPEADKGASTPAPKPQER